MSRRARQAAITAVAQQARRFIPLKIGRTVTRFAMNPPALLLALASAASAQSLRLLHSYERQQLTDRYFSEGINAADINGDGQTDIIHGPFWFAGPDWKQSQAIYPPVPQNRDGYADNFFSWPHDFNADGRPDILTVGLPGSPAVVYENPGAAGFNKPWPKHQVFDWVSNESPHFVDLTGDGKPELICTCKGVFGYASPNWSDPWETWTWHPVSEKIAAERFGHGLGVGDVNSDGRLDVLMQSGWFEQPAARGALWKLHSVTFAQRGGAEMFAYDVDGDGDSDVITSLAAHEFGLSWWEQNAGEWKEHLIMGDRPALNAYGVVFSELHSVQLADMDGDGLKDIVTGKTYWSHHRQSPGWNDGAVVYWFRLVRGPKGADWVPVKADGEAGIGRQIVIADVNADKLPDILTGGMVGAHVLLHRTKEVSEADWLAAQPKCVELKETPPLRGAPAPIDEKTGAVAGAVEGESFSAKPGNGTAGPQSMKGFAGAKWSGGAQLFWRGGGPGDTLELELNAPAAGDYTLESVFTVAPDYAMVQIVLDGRDIGPALDLYDFSKVATTGVISHAAGRLENGPHKLAIRITGANPRAQQSRFVGLDYVRLVPAK
jgi:hypothetical protein